MIQLYTGDGKGKTTAAAGLAARAAGSGLRVLFSQFMKGNDTGELHVLKNLPQVTILRSPKQFGFYRTLGREEIEELTQIHNRILDEILKKVENRDCDVVVLDEITYPVSWGLVDAEKLKRLLTLAANPPMAEEAAGCPGERLSENSPGAGFPELVLTGRNPADFMTERADYITEMRAVRHPFEKGIAARKGIEY